MKKENDDKIIKDKFNIISEEKINQYMSVNEYTADMVSEALDKHTRTYYYKKNGKTEFTASEIWILTKIFDCEIDDLTKRANEMTDSEKLRCSQIFDCKLEPKEKHIPLYSETTKKSKNLNVSVSSKSKFNIISGDKIKYFMDINGYTSDKIAEILNKERRTFFYKKKGDTEFTATEIWILMQLFDCELEDLLKDENEMTEEEKKKYTDVLNGNLHHKM